MSNNEVPPIDTTHGGQGAIDEINKRRASNQNENVSADIARTMQDYARNHTAAERQAFNDQLFGAAKNDPELKKYLPEINLIDMQQGGTDGTAVAAQLGGPDAVKVDAQTGTITDGERTVQSSADGKSSISDDHHGHVDVIQNGQARHYDDVNNMVPVDANDPSKGTKIHQVAVDGKHPESTTIVRPDGTFDTTLGKEGDPNTTTIHGNADGSSTTHGKNFTMEAGPGGTTRDVSIANHDGTLTHLTPEQAATAKLGPNGSMTYDRAENNQTTHVSIEPDGKETLTFSKADGSPGTDSSGATTVKRDQPGGPIVEKDFKGPNNTTIKVGLNEKGDMTTWTMVGSDNKTVKQYTFENGGVSDTTDPNNRGSKVETSNGASPTIGPDGQLHFVQSGNILNGGDQSRRTDDNGNLTDDSNGHSFDFKNWNK